jgi:hypothetical protein
MGIILVSVIECRITHVNRDEKKNDEIIIIKL